MRVCRASNTEGESSSSSESLRFFLDFFPLALPLFLAAAKVVCLRVVAVFLKEDVCHPPGAWQCAIIEVSSSFYQKVNERLGALVPGSNGAPARRATSSN